MKNKEYVFLSLIFLIFILSISAVSAAGDFAENIDSADNQNLILEASINQDVTTSADDIEELTSAENNKQDVSASTNEKDISGNKNTKLTSKTKKVSKKATSNAKSSAKKTTAFKTISKGSKDKAMVKKIQKALKKNGYYIRYKGHYLKVDGWYGPCTVRSVKHFQKAKKLKVTGKVDYKTALKLKIIKRSKTNAIIKLYCKNTFTTDYNSGKSFTAKVISKKTGKGIETVFRVDYIKKGFRNYEYYYTGEDGINYITPDELKVGTYKAKVSTDESGIKATPVTRTIKVVKTNIRLKANAASIDSNKNLKLRAVLNFKNNAKVNEGKVKFTIDGKSYIVKVQNGVAVKSIKLDSVKSNQYTVTFLGTKNINVKTATGKIK